jgi:predicted dehydrogenase
MEIGIVGMGYWGPNLVRNFLSNQNVARVVCYDSNPKKLDSIKQRFPMVAVVTDYRAMLKDPAMIAIVIATPVSTHFQLAKQALEAGKHVVIEKPMTDSVRDAETLVNIAEQKKLVLMVDHTFIYNGAVKKIKELVDKGEIGDIFYFDSVRVNLGLFQHDVNVLWDLAPHDISIMDHLIGKKPKFVWAVGANHFNSVEDVAYLTIKFEDNLIAHFHVNWLSPLKVRTILIGGSKKMIVYDDTEPSEKVKVYNKGIDIQTEEMVHDVLVQYRMGDMYAPQLNQTEALSLMSKEFIDSIINERKPLTDGIAGLNVVRILEASQESLRRNTLIPIAN